MANLRFLVYLSDVGIHIALSSGLGVIYSLVQYPSVQETPRRQLSKKLLYSDVSNSINVERNMVHNTTMFSSIIFPLR